eukprot:5262019-Pyramimonas_sp.AAC.1
MSEQRCCSELLTVATRHKPFHNDGLAYRFTGAVVSYDEFDGWVRLNDLPANWPPDGCDNYRKNHLDVVGQCLESKH